MADKPQNLQDAFLNQVRKEKIPLTIFLVNGVKLNGSTLSTQFFKPLAPILNRRRL